MGWLQVCALVNPANICTADKNRDIIIINNNNNNSSSSSSSSSANGTEARRVGRAGTEREWWVDSLG